MTSDPGPRQYAKRGASRRVKRAIVLSEAMDRYIRREANRTHQSFSKVLNDLLEIQVFGEVKTT